MKERDIENEILKQNKIPGCDQLTRPEEIKALSKYLKSIRKVQENHTSLEKDNLEIPGRTTGRIPKVDSLEDYVEGLDGVRGIKNLYKESSRVELSDNTNDNSEGINLYTEKIRENLKDNRKNSLENYQEKLKKINREESLENHQEKINPGKEIEDLYSETIGLDNIKDVRNLYINTKEKLRDNREELKTLNNHKEDLIDNQNQELDLTRIDLEGFRDLSYKEQLEIDSKNELDTTKVNLEKSPKNVELESTRENLKKTSEELSKLRNYRESLITEDSLKELDNTRIKLNNSTSELDELPENKISLRSPLGDQELENYKEDLRKTPEELSKLENYREKLREKQEELDDLPTEKITLERSTKNPEKLENTKINLRITEDAEIKDLRDYRESLSVEDDNSLEDTRIDLKDTEESKISTLEDYKENLVVRDDNSLEDKKINLGNTKESEILVLEDTRIDLTKTEESEISTLEDYRESLSVEDDNSLEDTRIDLKDTEESKISTLEDYKENLVVRDDNSLEDKKINLGNTKESEISELENYRENLNVDDNNSLGDTRIDLKNTKESEQKSLENERIDLGDIKETESLEDFIDKLEDSRELELEDKKLNLLKASGDEYEGYNPLGPEELDSLGGDLSNFYDSILGVPDIKDAPRQSGDYNPLGPEELDNLGGNLENFYDSILEVPEDTEENHTIEKLGDISLDLPETSQKAPRELGDYSYLSPEEVEKIIENPTYFYNQQKEIPETDNKNYLSPEEVEKIIENPTYFYNQQKEIPEAQAPDGQVDYEYLEDPELSSKRVDGLKMKLPEFGLESLNLNNYLRWTAEKAVGWTGTHGKARQLLLNETLAGLVVARDELEKATKSNRYRLPGNDGGLLGDLVSGGVSGALDNLGNKLGKAINSVIGGKSVDISNPVNRPDKDKYKYDGFEEANTRSTSSNASNPIKSYSSFSSEEIDLLKKITDEGEKKNSSSSFWKKAGNALKEMAIGSSGGERTYNFKNNYVSGKGILTTLEELCGVSSDSSDANTVEGLYNLLKSSPFITTPDKFTSTGYSNYNVQTLDSNAYWEISLEPYAGPENGDLCYLPGIHEINIRNISQHGVNTAYNKWIPFTGFDLQKSKLTNKTLSLYDGEISYPVSMEFTNELRITIADDQYKSWRRYFEECAKAAIYNSEGHSFTYYQFPTLEYTLTAIDTNNICIAMYKNICFRCRVYVMTPQYSTIQKFDLLLVMKDFSEEYTGDIGDGAGDLTVSFSIVGENPAQYIPRPLIIQHESSNKKTKTDYGSIIESGVNSVMKLIK